MIVFNIIIGVFFLQFNCKIRFLTLRFRYKKEQPQCSRPELYFFNINPRDASGYVGAEEYRSRGAEQSRIVADVIADVSALSGVSDVPRQLFRRRRSGADEGDAGKNVGNHIGDYRIMGASEDQGVDLSVTEGMKVMLAGQPGDLAAATDKSALDKRNEKRAVLRGRRLRF